MHGARVYSFLEGGFGEWRDFGGKASWCVDVWKLGMNIGDSEFTHGADVHCPRAIITSVGGGE